MPRHVRLVRVAVQSARSRRARSLNSVDARPLPVSQQASAAGGHIRGVVHDQGTRSRRRHRRRDGHDARQARRATPPADSAWPCRPASTSCAPRATATSRRTANRCACRRARSSSATSRYPSRPDAPPGDARRHRRADARRSPDPSSAATSKDADHAHDEAAWRLRHLPRTALRDVAPGTEAIDRRTAVDSREHPVRRLAPDGSARAVDRLATPTSTDRSTTSRPARCRARARSQVPTRRAASRRLRSARRSARSATGPMRGAIERRRPARRGRCTASTARARRRRTCSRSACLYSAQV